jgi:hypothetical protein
MVTDNVILYKQVKQCIRVCRNGRPVTPIKWEVLRLFALLAVCNFVERRIAVILRFICPPSFTTWCHWLKIKHTVQSISAYVLTGCRYQRCYLSRYDYIQYLLMRRDDNCERLQVRICNEVLVPCNEVFLFLCATALIESSLSQP